MVPSKTQLFLKNDDILTTLTTILSRVFEKDKIMKFFVFQFIFLCNIFGNPEIPYYYREFFLKFQNRSKKFRENLFSFMKNLKFCIFFNFAPKNRFVTLQVLVLNCGNAFTTTGLESCLVQKSVCSIFRSPTTTTSWTFSDLKVPMKGV